MQGAGLLQAASEQPRAQIAASEQPRAQMQQWARFPLYLTQDVWNILQGSSERQLRSKKRCSVGQGSKVSKEYDKTRMCILKIKGKIKDTYVFAQTNHATHMYFHIYPRIFLD